MLPQPAADGACDRYLGGFGIVFTPVRGRKRGAATGRVRGLRSWSGGTLAAVQRKDGETG